MYKITLALSCLLGTSYSYMSPVGLDSAKCTTLTSMSSCMNAVNNLDSDANGKNDTSKCLPIKRTSGYVCASTLEVEENGY